MADIKKLTLDGVTYDIKDATARESITNISNSLATVATTGDYDDLTNKPTIPSIDDLFADVVYDSNSKHINFYGKGDAQHTNVLAYVDASDFVVDGMVEDVRIENGNLVIDFNTDSGITDISIPLTDIFDPSNYYTKTEVDTALAGKANSSSLATVATSGSYNDLSDKPTIPAAQVQSDWNESDNTSKAYILNKPTIPAAQVNSDWNASSGVTQILNKPTLATVATSGSYNDLSDKPVIPAGVTVDQTLDTSSTNAIANSAVATALNGKASQSDIATAIGNIASYNASTETLTLNFTQS